MEIKNEVTEILESVEALIKEMETGHKSPRTIKTEIAYPLLKRVRDCRRRIQSGEISVKTKKTFWLFWNDDKHTLMYGDNAAEAFGNLGYGGGAIAAVDFHAEEPSGAQMVARPPTFPNGPVCQEFVMDRYRAGINAHFAKLKEKLSEKDYVHALEDFFCAYDDDIVLTRSYPGRKAEFMGIHQMLVRSLNPSTRHGKMYFEKFFQKTEGGEIHAILDMYSAEKASGN